LEAELARRHLEAARIIREERIAAERGRRSKLVAMATDLRSADDIRALMARVMAQRAADDEVAARWVAWALDVAGMLDPSMRCVFDPTVWVPEADIEENGQAPSITVGDVPS
jgi:hypothetical protein